MTQENADVLIQLAFGIPLALCLGIGAGVFVVRMFTGIDLTLIFKRGKEDEES